MAHTESTFNSRDLPFFDGSGDVEIFIEYVEKMTKIKGWSNEANKDNIVLHVCCALEKEAAVWASGIRLHNIGTWEEAKGRLLTRWKPPMTYMTAIATLVKEKKKPRESYYAYVDRLRNIARYNKDVTEDNVIEAFLKGIPHKYAITKPKEAHKRINTSISTNRIFDVIFVSLKAYITSNSKLIDSKMFLNC